MKKFDMDEQTSNKELLGMTHYVDLPTGGKFYPEDHPWHGHSSVEIKMLTTREEEILTNQSYIEKGVVVDKLLESILIPSVPSDLKLSRVTALLYRLAIFLLSDSAINRSVCSLVLRFANRCQTKHKVYLLVHQSQQMHMIQ